MKSHLQEQEGDYCKVSQTQRGGMFLFLLFSSIRLGKTRDPTDQTKIVIT